MSYNLPHHFHNRPDGSTYGCLGWFCYKRPLGIADLILSSIADLVAWEEVNPLKAEVHFWCRRHEQAHKLSKPCIELTNDPTQGKGIVVYDKHDCIDIGPFMSEREANRLAEGWDDINVIPPVLGMEVQE